MTSSLDDLVLLFYGRDANDDGGQQDLPQFIQTLNFAMDEQVYTNESRRKTITRVIFRIHL